MGWSAVECSCVPCWEQREVISCSLDSFGDVVHILRLHGGYEVVLQDAREVVLQLAAPEVLQDLLPVWR